MNQEQLDFLDSLYRKSYNALYSYAASRLNDSQRAEDVVMQTFTAAIKKVNKLMKSPNPEGWLMDALKKEILHEMRSLARHPAPAPLDSVPDIAVPDTTEPSPLITCLTNDEERLVGIIYGEQRSVAEAAAELHISVAACKKRLQRIRDKVKKFFEN